MKMRMSLFRPFALVLLAVYAGTTQAAEVNNSHPISQAPPAIAAPATPDMVSAQIKSLIADNKRLRTQLRDLSGQMTEMENNTPSCATDNPSISLTKSGIKTNCYPRICNPETGLCVPRPLSTGDCAAGSTFDGTARCITPAGGALPGYHAEAVDKYYVFWVNDNHDCGPNHQWVSWQGGCVPKLRTPSEVVGGQAQ